MSKNKWMARAGLGVALLCGLLLGACDADEEYSDNDGCPRGDVIQYQDQSFCIVIEEGFLTSECPEGFPEGVEIDGVIVCAEDGAEIPDGLDDELERRGYKEDDNNGGACEELEEEHTALIQGARACEVDADCQILRGACGAPTVGCYEAVNQSLTQAQLDDLSDALEAGQCVPLECTCDVAPAGAACDDGVCVPLPDEGNNGNNGDVCEEGEEVYAALVADAKDCDVDADCQILFGVCGSPAGDCYEAVNQSLGQEELGAAASALNANGCLPPCQCDEAPAGASCEAGRCVVADGPPINDTCEGIDVYYDDLVREAKSCEVAADCQALNGQCGVGLGGCYEIVNQSLTQEQLNEAAAQWTGARCDENVGVCDCAPPPTALACDEGVCVGRDEPACEPDGIDVCGLDGRPYDDRCAALDAGTQVAYVGDCRRCPSGESCEEGEACVAVDGLCGEGGGRVCLPADPACEGGESVCGCDGQMYPSQCEALRAGVAVSQFGGCPGPEGTFACYDLTCDRGQACRISANDTPVGTPYYSNCVALPDDCAQAPSCDTCYPDIDPFETCVDQPGNLILYSPGG